MFEYTKMWTLFPAKFLKNAFLRSAHLFQITMSVDSKTFTSMQPLNPYNTGDLPCPSSHAPQGPVIIDTSLDLATTTDPLVTRVQENDENVNSFIQVYS